MINRSCLSYGGFFLYNQIEAVLSQYEMEIYEVTKGRGSYICNTSKGMRQLIGFRGAAEKGTFLQSYLEALKNDGFSVEQIERNKEGNAVTVDEGTGEHFILKEYIAGTELNVGQLKEVKEAVALLAEYHTIAVKTRAAGVENYVHNHASMIDEKRRHIKEFIKVKNYIRSRKKKNEFERIYMNHYRSMLETAERSVHILENVTETKEEYSIYHGAFHQHNVVYYEKKWHIINFESFVYAWSILDLVNFLRKMQEKNDWELQTGLEILNSYTKVRPLKKQELEKLYALLLFPEKFWKVTNHYINSRKTWISERDIEKLEKVIAQEEKRLKFMENLFSMFSSKGE